MVSLSLQGLTDEEISTAESKVQPQQLPTTAGPLARAPPLPPRSLPPAAHPPPKPRTWSELAVLAAVVGGVSYAFVHFVKVRHA